jgi:large subunit ribosomal protein L29
MMKASDIREWDNTEIRARLQELEEEKFRLRFKMGTMELENPKMVQHVRRDVARLNTIIRERESSETAEALDETQAATLEATPEAVDEAVDGQTDETADEPPETED